MHLTLGHSPDPDDAFMFWALATNQFDTGEYTFEHILQDIQTLNERATRGELHITAISIHSYAHLMDKYALLPTGSSMGDGYGPMLVAKKGSGLTVEDLKSKKILIPGKMTTAYLASRLLLGDFDCEVAMFDEIPAKVRIRRVRGRADHPRGAAHLRGRGARARLRSRRVVGEGNRPAAPARGQRDPA